MLLVVGALKNKVNLYKNNFGGESMKKRLDFNQRIERREQLDNAKRPFNKFLGIGYINPVYIDAASKKNKAKKAKRR